jgi:hypothetical protein
LHGQRNRRLPQRLPFVTRLYEDLQLIMKRPLQRAVLS